MDFKEQKKLVRALTELDRVMQEMMAAEGSQKRMVRNAASALMKQQAALALIDISTDELAQAKAGIRISVLKDAGYLNLGQLFAATDGELRSISGIGEAQVTAIRDLLAKFCEQLAASGHLRLSVEDPSKENLDLILALARYRRSGELRAESGSLAGQLHDFAGDALGRLKIRNRLRWIFSGRAAKDETTLAMAEIIAFFKSPLFMRCSHLVADWQEIGKLSVEAAMEDFKRHGADYYALLEAEGDARLPQELIYSSIPAQLAARVDAMQLNLKDFRGHLRAYQAFGAKYILHQKRVLLGDEMGLGKTIQAIAAMAHLEAENPGQHFLIVCPASVLVNWCRELRKFSLITPYLVHGPYLEKSFKQWQEKGGAAVTNYETMDKIVDRIDNHMHLAMLVIDEAHYIKNPDARRTKNIRRLDNEAGRILLMTGTPMENHVAEMCSLVDFIRPDLADEIRHMMGIRHAERFRELLSPLYLRRLREQVLDELPPVETEEEWCRMTAQDLRAYIDAVNSKNFQAMRRIAFLQNDLKESSKAIRLMEIVSQAGEEGRKVLIYSFFRETVDKVAALLDKRCAGVVTGSVPADARQSLIDRFADAPDGSALVCQIQAGGMGLNIQAASVVIFCEPQIKPSLTSQAMSRVYRMGQVRNVLVYHLLCEDTVDEAVKDLLAAKQDEFDTYADASVIADAEAQLLDKEWISKVIEQEKAKYLPAVIG